MEQCFCHVWWAEPKCNSQQVLKKVYIYKKKLKVTQKWVHLIRLQPTELENKRPRQETEGHMATETNMLTTNTMTWQKSIWQMNTNTNRKQDTRHKVVYWKLYTKGLCNPHRTENMTYNQSLVSKSLIYNIIAKHLVLCSDLSPLLSGFPAVIVT